MNGVKSKSWEDALSFFESRFGGGLDVQSVIYLIGIQELGKGEQKLSKDEKLDIMHIAICKLLSFYGYYEFAGYDDEGWPHWNRIKKLPAIVPEEQEHFMKEAIVNYLQEEAYW